MLAYSGEGRKASPGAAGWCRRRRWHGVHDRDRHDLGQRLLDDLLVILVVRLHVSQRSGHGPYGAHSRCSCRRKGSRRLTSSGRLHEFRAGSGFISQNLLHAQQVVGFDLFSYECLH